MLVLSGYFDESGTDSLSKAVSVAGFVSTVEQWEVFTVQWRQAMKEFGIERDGLRQSVIPPR